MSADWGCKVKNVQRFTMLGNSCSPAHLEYLWNWSLQKNRLYKPPLPFGVYRMMTPKLHWLISLKKTKSSRSCWSKAVNGIENEHFQSRGQMFLISSGLFGSLWGAGTAAWCAGKLMCRCCARSLWWARGEHKVLERNLWAVSGKGRRNLHQDIPLPPPLTCFSWPAASLSHGHGQFLWDSCVGSLDQGYFALGSSLHLNLTKIFCFYWLFCWILRQNEVPQLGVQEVGNLIIQISAVLGKQIHSNEVVKYSASRMS